MFAFMLAMSDVSYTFFSSLGIHHQQRMEQKNRLDGKTSSLTDSRFERLQSIGFRWAKRKGQASWDEKLVSSMIGHCKTCFASIRTLNSFAFSIFLFSG